MDEPIFRSKSFSELAGLTVVIPCFKEDEELVTQTYTELTLLGAEVIVVDDGGNMDFIDEVNLITYRPHMGYGYAIKEGIKKASNPVICTADGDGEHRVDDIVKLYIVFKLITDCSMLVGCRWNKKESKIRWFGRKVINFLAACWSRHMLPDLNSGLRIFKRELAIGYSPILCDTFSFTTSLTMCMVTDNHKVAWFPVDNKARAYGKSHVKPIKDGLVTIFYVFWIGFALRTRKLRALFRYIVTLHL